MLPFCVTRVLELNSTNAISFAKKLDMIGKDMVMVNNGRSIDYANNHRLSAALFLVLIYLIAFSLMKVQRVVMHKLNSHSMSE